MTPKPREQPAHLRRLGAAALLMMSAVFLSRIIGYLREAFVAHSFGANPITDAFYAAFTIPDFLNYLLAGGTLSITFLPVYARYLAADDEAQANHVLSAVATALLAVFGVLVLLAEIFARPLATWLFGNMEPQALDACVRFTRILLPAQIFFLAGGLLNATLFARGRFAAAALAPLLYNTGIIAGGATLGRWVGAEGLAWGALAGAAAGPFLVPAVDAWRAGARVRPTLAVRHPGFLEWVKLTLPLMIGVSLVTADDWILRVLADGVPGAISRLNYAKRLVAVPIAIAGQAIGQASMPFFARLFAENRRQELADTFLTTLRGAGVVALLAAAWMAGLAVPLVDLLFRRGHFSPADVTPTALYLAIFAAAVPLWSLQGLASRAFYAARNTLTPMLAGTAITILSLPFYVIAFKLGGPTGLAIASGIGILMHTAAVMVLLPRLLPELRASVAATLRRLGAGALLAVLSGAAAWATARAATAVVPVGGHQADLVACTVGSAAFAAVVLLLARPLGVTEVGTVVARVTRRFRRR